jgi:hypothetical protein
MTTRSKQKFEGILIDEELYLIEDALKAYKDMIGSDATKIDNLILKLYKFWEVSK